jgi:hypothetical protein
MLTCATIEVDSKLLTSPGFVIVDPVGIWVGNVADCHDMSASNVNYDSPPGQLTVVLHVHGRLVLEVLPNTREINHRFDSER